MLRNRLISAGLVTFGLTNAIHLDWHAARPVVHPMSLGLPWHWLLAAPVFALTAWYVLREWSDRAVTASLAIIGIAAIMAGLVEPAWEYSRGATLDWTFGTERLSAFGAFVATGVATHTAVLALARRRGETSRP